MDTRSLLSRSIRRSSNLDVSTTESAEKSRSVFFLAEVALMRSPWLYRCPSLNNNGWGKMEVDAIAGFFTMSTCHSTVTRNIPKHCQDDSIDRCQTYFPDSSSIVLDRNNYSISSHIPRRRYFPGLSRSDLTGSNIAFEVRVSIPLCSQRMDCLF